MEKKSVYKTEGGANRKMLTYFTIVIAVASILVGQLANGWQLKVFMQAFKINLSFSEWFGLTWI
jgi:hypothetical protein